MSTLFLRALREDPADAEVPSHRLLQRAGYVRRVAPGIFTWLPLGAVGIVAAVVKVKDTLLLKAYGKADVEGDVAMTATPSSPSAP